MGNPAGCFDGWNEPPDEVGKNRQDRQVEEEDGLPAPVLHDERSIEWPEYASRFSHHTDQAEGQRPLPFTVKVPPTPPCNRNHHPPPSLLHTSSPHTPH